MRKLLLAPLGALAFAASALAQEANCGKPVAMGDGWSIATPEEAEIDPAALCGLDKFIAQWPQANIHSVVVVRRGKLVMERYYKGEDDRWGTPLGTVAFAADVKHDLRSISKSVTSLLVGIALGEGKFPQLDSPVIDQFPELSALKTPALEAVTFRHLLTMSSGFAWDESIPYSNPANSERRLIASADPVRYVLEQPVVTTPGEVYNYNGGNTTLLAAVITRLTGKRIDEYASEKLFAPLGIQDFEWVSMPANGQVAAASGLRLRPRDTAKLGHLLLSDGVWAGTQVVPEGWGDESVQPRLNGDGLYFYGYQWWLGRTMVRGRELDWAAGVGFGGQRLFVQPDYDLVVMVNAGHYGSFLQAVIPTGIFYRLILPAVKD